MTVFPLGLDSLSYHVVYDVRSHGLGLPSALALLLASFAVIALLGIFPQMQLWIQRRLPFPFGKPRKSLAQIRSESIAVGGGGLLLLSFLLGVIVFDKWRLGRALEQGRFTAIEGEVTHFARGDSVRRIAESFDVDGHHYAFQKWLETDGFNGDPGGHDVIGDGMRVRIAEVKGVIVQVAIAK